MKKLGFQLFAILCLLLLPGSALVFGQNPTTLRVNIPFQFVIDRTTLPAGEYVVVHLSPDSPDVLRIESLDGRTSAFIDAEVPLGGLRFPEKSKLVFNQYGDSYFLSQIWTVGDPVGRKVLPSHLERELALKLEASNKGMKPETVMVSGQ